MSGVDIITDYNGFYCILSRRSLPLVSGVDIITDYNGFYCILSHRSPPLVSGVDTVRATQMHKLQNTEFCSLLHLFVPEMTHTPESMSHWLCLHATK